MEWTRRVEGEAVATCHPGNLAGSVARKVVSINRHLIPDEEQSPPPGGGPAPCRLAQDS